MSAFRAEVEGSLSLLEFVKNTGLHAPLTIYLDCESAIAKSRGLTFQDPTPQLLQTDHIDVLWPAACHLKHMSQVELKYVKAHTADNTTRSSFPIQVTLNK